MYDVWVKIRVVKAPHDFEAVVSVVGSDGGACTSGFTLRDHDTFGRKGMTINGFYSGATRLSPADQQDFGHALWQRIFHGATHERLLSAMEAAVRDDPPNGFRLFLELPETDDAPIIFDVPYEFMNPNAQYGFLFSKYHHRLVRMIRTDIAATLPYGRRLLIVTSNPTGAVEDFDEERLFNEIKLAAQRANFDVACCRRATWQKFQDHAANSRYDWIHFIGHGDNSADTGLLLFEAERGADPVPADTFANEVRQHGIKVAFIQACKSGSTPRAFTGVAQALLNPLNGNLALVLATLDNVNSISSTRYAVRVYHEIRQGRTLDEARQRALDVYRERDAEWGFMALFARTTDFSYSLQYHPWTVDVRPGTRYAEPELRSIELHSNDGRSAVIDDTSPLPIVHETYRRSPDEDAANDLTLAVSRLDKAVGVLPPRDFAGVIAFTGRLSGRGVPWEHLPDPRPGQPLSARKVPVVRELARLDDRWIESLESDKCIALNIAAPEDAFQLAAGMADAAFSFDSALANLRDERYACIILTVLVVDGRPQQPSKHRDPPLGPLTEARLHSLRRKLMLAPAKLLLLDLVGATDIAARIEGDAGLGEDLGLVATLLRLSFAHAVLAPLAASGDPGWRRGYLESCRGIVDALRAGDSLRSVVDKVRDEIEENGTLALCVSNTFRKVCG